MKYQPPKTVKDITLFDTKCMELRAKIDANRELYRAIGIKRTNLDKSQKLRQKVNEEVEALFKELTKKATVYKILVTVGMKYKNTLYPLNKRLNKIK